MFNNLLKCLLVVFCFSSAGFAGCLSNPVSFEKCEDDSNCLTIAFEAKEEYRNSDENPQKMADHLAEILGMDVEIYPVSSPAATIEALRFGHAAVAHNLAALTNSNVSEDIGVICIERELAYWGLSGRCLLVW